MLLDVDEIGQVHLYHASGLCPSIQSDWTKLNESDAIDINRPRIEDLIQRNVRIIEVYLTEVIRSRYNEQVDRGTRKDRYSYPTSTETSIRFPAEAREQLLDYVSSIAHDYRSVLYHNFEHASHVLLSSHMLIQLSRGAHKSENCDKVQNSSLNSVPVSDNNVMFDISSCSMANLALVISALVHDVDHQGVGNQQLVNEKSDLSHRYHGKSVAENNSIDIALNLLKEVRFECLRECMFGSSDTDNPTEDAKLFESLVHDMILSTDINSKECIERNKKKWEMAFKEEVTSAQYHHFSSGTDSIQRDSSQISYLQMSSVLEQMIQTADVAHCMQSWPVFLKWGHKLFHEIWAANLAGRGPEVPADWFQCQIDFFEYYIFGLARRIEECGMFGSFVSVFLENASNNRDRWMKEGKTICAELYAEVGETLRETSE